MNDDTSPPDSLTMQPLSSLGASSLITECSKPEKSSRQRGLDELDLLGESLLKQHLPEKSPQFEKKKVEKLSLNVLQQKQKQKDLTTPEIPDLIDSKEVKPIIEKPASPKNESPKEAPLETSKSIVIPEEIPIQVKQINGNNSHNPNLNSEEVKLADLNVPLSNIKPGSTPPLTLQESDDGISIVLHFGQDQPREHVTAIVVTVINKLNEAIADYELKAVVPKGCKIKLQTPTTTSLPAHNPFVPPSAITQVMLIANPMKLKVSLKYIVSYTIDNEPQTEMGQVAQLPI